MGTAMIEKPASSKRRTIIVLVASIVAVALAVTGLACGLHARNARAAEEAHRKTVAAAQATCDRSIDRLAAARASLARRTKADRTQAALKLTDRQVADTKTLRTLRRETSDRYAAKACRTDSITVLKRNAEANRNAAEQAAAQSTRLTAAVTGVEKSKTAKDEADRKAEEQRKADEARRQQEEAQQAAAVTQAASSAPVKRQSSSSNSSASSHSSTVRRQSSAPRRSYQAPRRSYTPQRRNTYTPRRQHTAPRRTYTPSVPRRSGPSPSRPSAPRRSYTPSAPRQQPRRQAPAAPGNNNSSSSNGSDQAIQDGQWHTFNGGHHHYDF